MSLINSIFNRRKLSTQREDKRNSPKLMMLFQELPIINYKLISEKIQDIEIMDSNVEVLPDDSIDSSMEDETLLAVIKFQDHKIKLLGEEGAISEDIIKHTVECTNITEEQKEYIKKHNASISLQYEGQSEEPTEIYIALYKVIYAFVTENLRGVLNIDAWNCQTTETVINMMSDKIIYAARKNPMLALWTNYLHLSLEYGTWLFTKGYNIFGMKDIAYFGNSDDADRINFIFEKIFYSAINKEIQLKLNETMKLEDGTLIRFKELKKENYLLDGFNETLQFEILNKVR